MQGTYQATLSLPHQSISLVPSVHAALSVSSDFHRTKRSYRSYLGNRITCLEISSREWNECAPAGFQAKWRLLRGKKYLLRHENILVIHEGTTYNLIQSSLSLHSQISIRLLPRERRARQELPTVRSQFPSFALVNGEDGLDACQETSLITNRDLVCLPLAVPPIARASLYDAGKLVTALVPTYHVAHQPLQNLRFSRYFTDRKALDKIARAFCSVHLRPRQPSAVILRIADVAL